MEAIIEQVLSKALESLKSQGKAPVDFTGPIAIERPKRPEFGDFGCALPLALARASKRPPADCARDLIAALEPPEGLFDEIAFAPPGYVNFRVRPSAWFAQLDRLFAIPQVGAGQRVLLEFVSANPTGPLHVGHGRGAILGDAMARLMRTVGFAVETEYLLNDVGNQMGMLGRSLHARGREILGLPIEFPENGYQGQYIRELAQAFVDTHDGRAICERPYDDVGPADDNAAVRFASSRLLDSIKDTLDSLDVHFDHWFSERALHSTGRVQASIDALLSRGAAYRDGSGAILFKMDDTDDEDRVIVRSNGVPTYFASDIAYHDEKAQRGYDRLINIWGADHHGYIPRIKASMATFGHDAALLQVVLVQMVTLIRNGEVVPMGKRTGRFVTLREIVEEVGPDAVRFLFLQRRADAQMDFDVDLARAQTMENPVYYVQYGHARVASILRKAALVGHEVPAFDPALESALSLPEERAMIRDLARFPQVVVSAASQGEPHHVAFYLMDMVKGFHSYYTRYKTTEKVISSDLAKTSARLYLVSRIQAVLGHGLGLLGVSAPESMHHGAEDEQT